MSIKRFPFSRILGALMFVVSFVGFSLAHAEDNLPSKSDQSCLKCHDYNKKPNIIAGKLKEVSVKANAIQVQVGKDTEVLLFDDKTVLKNASSVSEIPKGESVKVIYQKRDGKTFAKEIEVKKGLAVPKHELISTEEVEKLVAKGPKAGHYILLDSRPSAMFNEGHIPTAVSMPFFDFDKLVEKVLKDKNVLQIYYCAGLSCVLSPMAAKKAKSLGFRAIKVYHAGLPAWKKAGNIIVSEIGGLERLNKLQASYILMDLRPTDMVTKSHIPNAVSVPIESLDSIKSQLPGYKAAPIIIYDQRGIDESTVATFKKISAWGYTNVSILSKGFSGWQKEGMTVATGPADTKITFVRKLLPGEISLDDFRRQLEHPSPKVVILDVRLPSETRDGLFPNSIQVPLDDIESKVSDLPRDKEILVHCSTGARAEMAYAILKKAGFNVKYLRAKVDFDKDGKGSYKFEE